MYYWTVFAQICNGEVKNIVVGDAYDCLQSAIAVYGNGSEVVNISNPIIPVRIGDKYDGTHFKRDGEIIEPLPDESNAVKNATIKSNSAIDKANTNGMSIVDIENAILEIYDIIGGLI